MIGNYIARFNFPDVNSPTRCYLHQDANDLFSNIEDAGEYLLNILDKNKLKFSNFDYLLASFWNEKSNKMIDFFGFSGLNSWPGNPVVSSFRMKDLNLQLKEIIRKGDTTSSDFLIILGKEEEYRRTRRNIVDYFKYVPNFNEYEPKFNFVL